MQRSCQRGFREKMSLEAIGYVFERRGVIFANHEDIFESTEAPLVI